MAAAVAGDHRRPSEREMLDALWDLVWAGLITNDTFAPLRTLSAPTRRGGRTRKAGGAVLGIDAHDDLVGLHGEVRRAGRIQLEEMGISGMDKLADERFDLVISASPDFADARVLSIFEGAEETLALKVITRSLVENAA